MILNDFVEIRTNIRHIETLSQCRNSFAFRLNIYSHCFIIGLYQIFVCDFFILVIISYAVVIMYTILDFFQGLQSILHEQRLFSDIVLFTCTAWTTKKVYLLDGIFIVYTMPTPRGAVSHLNHDVHILKLIDDRTPRSTCQTPSAASA